MGTDIGGPVFNENGGILRYKGKKVFSKLNLQNLQDLSEKLNGDIAYTTYSNDDLDKFPAISPQKTIT